MQDSPLRVPRFVRGCYAAATTLLLATMAILVGPGCAKKRSASAPDPVLVRATPTRSYRFPAPRRLVAIGDLHGDFEATRSVRPGQTRSYGWVAQQIGRPAAVRAVGTALARNPIPIIIPCHRIVRGDGDVGSYLFGTDRKRRLLEIEAA